MSPETSFLSLDVVANAGMGLVKGGRWVATFGMHCNAPRKWTATEIWLLEETAERTWAAVERAKAEKALHQSEEKYRTLFTSMDQGFAFCELVRNKEGKGIDYYVLEVNPTYEKQSGISMEMVLGKTILQAFPTVDKQHIDTYVAVVDNQQPIVFEQYFEVTHRWFELKVNPGEKDKFVVLFSDITEHKRSETNLAFLAGINLDFAPILTPQEVMKHVAEKLAKHLHLSRCHFSIVDEEQDRIEVIYDFRADEKLPSVMGVHHISELVTEEARRLYKANKLVVLNSASDSPLVKVPAQMLKEMGIGSLVDVPHLEAGKWKFVLTIIRAEVYEWRSDEIELLQELTSRIYIRLDRARAEEGLRKTEERLRLATQASAIYWWEFDFKTNVTLYSSNTEKVIGTTPAKTLEGNLLFLHPDDRKIPEQAFEEAIKNSTDHFNFVVRSIAVPSEIRWLHVSGRIIRDYESKPVLAVGISQNITESKQAEEKIKESEKQLRELSIGLEQKVRQRTTQLEEKNTELQNMNRELEAFAYVSSHDLQEPLRKLQTFASRILDKENQNLSDNGKNYFRLMQHEAQRMKTLIQDLLAFSQLNTADRKFENTDLNIIIEEVKKEFKETIAEKHAVIEVKEICEVHVIPFQFRQLMHNLISNALKFSNPKIPPHITIESHNVKYSKVNIANLPIQKEYCHISITDNGIGFEKEFSTKIFEVFQRLYGKEEYAGTGIGLAIVKKIVDNHNGIITARGALNKGATFDIYLPAGQAGIPVSLEK